MLELHAALFVHKTRQGVHEYRPTHHTHSARVFRVSRPGAIGTLELLPGDSRTTVLWRSSR